MPPNQSHLLPKVARILDHLSVVDANATELAAALGEPRSTIYRLLKALGEIGWAEETGARGVWRLGGEIFRLSAAAIGRIDERQIARPHLERLHNVTEQTVFLCIRHEMHAVCIDRIDGLHVATLALRLGGSLPLHVGAAPQVLLAFGDTELWDAYRAHARQHPPRSFTDKTVASVDAVMKQLTQVRDQGYALSDGDVTSGVAAVGAPVFNRNGELVASVSVSGLRDDIITEDRHVIDLVTTTARSVSRSLGYREPTSLIA